ncbi:MAG: tyrosine-type recombinase/integrase [Clostridia bacterium]|nr:tyrosine-type recombinase/integrase [Clostridia bacterium]
MKKEIEETIKAWQRDNIVRNLSPDSLETYAASAKDFMKFFEEEGISRFKQITDNIVKDYVFFQLERDCMPRTINNRLKALRRLCHFYQEEIKPGYSIPNFVFQREEMTVRSPLSDEDVCKLTMQFSPDDSDSVLVAFILDTGVRSKTVRNVRAEDVDFERGFVTLRVTKNRDVLVLPMSDILNNLLRMYLVKSHIKDGPLFQNTDGGKMYDRSTVYKAVKRYMARCGVNKTGVHLFRYTFGKIMVENNCNAMMLQRWLGHRTMEETKKYVRLYSNELKNVCEQVTPLSRNGKIFKKLAAEC